MGSRFHLNLITETAGATTIDWRIRGSCVPPATRRLPRTGDGTWERIHRPRIPIGQEERALKTLQVRVRIPPGAPRNKPDAGPCCDQRMVRFRDHESSPEVREHHGPMLADDLL